MCWRPSTGLVCWDEYGSVRFWTKAGDPIESKGAARAGWVLGVLETGEALVGCGAMTVRYGSNQAVTRSRTRARPMRMWARSVACCRPEQALVSGGMDGSIRFWTKGGDPMGARKASSRMNTSER